MFVQLLLNGFDDSLIWCVSVQKWRNNKLLLFKNVWALKKVSFKKNDNFNDWMTEWGKIQYNNA